MIEFLYIALVVIAFIAFKFRYVCRSPMNLPKDMRLVNVKYHAGYVYHLEEEIRGWRHRVKDDVKFQELIDKNQKLIDSYNEQYGKYKYRLHIGRDEDHDVYSQPYVTYGYHYCDSPLEAAEFIKKIVDFEFLKQYPLLEDNICNGSYPPRCNFKYRFVLRQASEIADAHYCSFRY